MRPTKTEVLFFQSHPCMLSVQQIKKLLVTCER